MKNSSLPYFQCKTGSGEVLNILIDTGSNKNYIQPRFVKKPILNDQCFYANSVGGQVKITHQTLVNLFNIRNHEIKFFLLPTLVSFHAILGNDSLKDLSAVIHTKHNFMTIQDTIRIEIKQMTSQTVNAINIRNEHRTRKQNLYMESLTRKNQELFSEPDERLTYTAEVVGTIRTTSDTPIFTKFYPYPMALKEEVERQVEKLLEDGIIRPSRSPYNSPVWIVPRN